MREGSALKRVRCHLSAALAQHDGAVPLLFSRRRRRQAARPASESSESRQGPNRGPASFRVYSNRIRRQESRAESNDQSCAGTGRLVRPLAFCPRCERWSVIDLEGMIRAGYGERRLPITVRCKESGGEGQPHVRPLEQRERMSRLIHQWKPRDRSTGPRTDRGYGERLT
jgi:hypothetical protein